MTTKKIIKLYLGKKGTTTLETASFSKLRVLANKIFKTINLLTSEANTKVCPKDSVVRYYKTTSYGE